MKKVAILTNFFNADPAYSLNRSVQDQIKMLVTHGYRPTVLVLESPEWKDPPQMYGHSDVELVQLPRVSVSNQIEEDERLDDDVQHLYQAMEEALKEVDVVLTHDIIYQPSGLKLNIAGRKLAARFPGIRWFHWIHSATSPYRLLKDGVISEQHVELIEQKWPNSNAVFFNDMSIPRIAENFGYEECEVRIVPNPTDICSFLGLSDVITRLYAEKRLHEADFIATYPARLDRGKQVEWIIKIMARLKWQNQSVRLIVMDFHSTAGDKNTYRGELKQIAADWGLDELDLTFISEFESEYSYAAPHSIVRELLSLSHVFIIPSRSEGYPYVAQEAAIMGNLLVLNHDFPPFWDIYGKNALYFQFSSNIDKVSWKDGDTQTAYSDVQHDTRPERYPDANLREEKGQWIVSGDAAYADAIAMRIRFEFNNNMVLGQRQERLRDRNIYRVFREFIEPLFYVGSKDSCKKNF
jgi:glycosyltransferase involved in cell wall biosynthesis